MPRGVPRWARAYRFAALRGGVPERILKAARSGEVSGIVSLHILGESRDVLTRPRFGVDAGLVDSLAEEIAEFCEVLAVEHAGVSWSADPDDDPVVEAALQGRVDVVVTGDAHLLVLEVPGVRFLWPAELAAELRLLFDSDWLPLPGALRIVGIDQQLERARAGLITPVAHALGQL